VEPPFGHHAFGVVPHERPIEIPMVMVGDGFRHGRHFPVGELLDGTLTTVRARNAEAHD